MPRSVEGVGGHLPITPIEAPAPKTSAPVIGDAGHLFVASAGDERGQRDVALLNQIRAGAIDVAAGMKGIAHSGGFPVRTAKGYVFAFPAAPGVESIAVIGDHTNWAERPQQMQQENGLFWVEVPFDSKEAQPRYKLKITANGETSDVADPWARNYTYDAEGHEMSLVRASGPHCERYPAVSDGGFETTLRVWVPAGPVDRIMYGHDGQNLFNPRAPFGGWHLDEAVGPNTMIVGIDNTPERADWYTSTTNWLHTRDGWQEVGGKGDDFAKFCNTKVVDFIESRYPRPKARGLIGSSMGGDAAYLQLENDPGRFDMVAMLSGTFGWGKLTTAKTDEHGNVLETRTSNNETILDRARRLDLKGHQPTLVFYSGGSADNESRANDNFDETLELAKIFAQVHGYRLDENLFHAHAEGAPHGEHAWRMFTQRQQPTKNPIGIFEAMGRRRERGPLGPTLVGSLAPYNFKAGVPFHDLSGAATDGRRVVSVDDGGKSGQLNAVRIMGAGEPHMIPLSAAHEDLEDATWDPAGRFVVSTSLSAPTDERSRVTRFALSADGKSLENEETALLRAPLFEAMKAKIGADFAAQVEATPPKEGGLNLEGIAVDHTQPDTLVLGLRSPLYEGRALLAFTKSAFGDKPEIDFHQVDLGGHGVRGMEYIPKLGAFAIIGGPVAKANGYSLWLYKPGEEAKPLRLPGFDELRRPESVIQAREGGKDYLVVISEQSGDACAGAPFDFVKAELR